MIKQEYPLHPDSSMDRLLRERHLTTRKQQEQEWENFWIAQDSLPLALIALVSTGTLAERRQQREKITHAWQEKHPQAISTQPPHPSDENSNHQQ